MKKALALIVLFAMVIAVAPAFAQVPEPVVNEKADLENYGAKTAVKAANGVGNVALRWTQPFQDVRNNKNGEKGPIQVWVEGIGNGVVRTAAGVVEIITAPVPSVSWEKDAEMKL
jgi:hypothetical protein